MRKRTRSEALYAAVESLSRLTELMERRRRQLASQVGLSPQQWRVLEEIAREDFMPSLFARAQDCAPAAVSRSLRALLDRDLVEVSIAADDARRREYVLSAEGARVLGRVRRARERALDAVWGRFERADLERFADFGSALAERLDDHARQEGGGSD